MAKFVAKRFVYMIITLFLVFTATFFLLASIPGNALTMKIHKLPAQAQGKGAGFHYTYFLYVYDLGTFSGDRADFTADDDRAGQPV